MKEITITENPFFDFLPSRRFGWYILILIDLISILALALTGELYVWPLVVLLTLSILPGLINIIKARKNEIRSLHIQIDQDKISFRFENQTIDINKTFIKALIMQPSTAAPKNKMLINLICKCDKNDKKLLSDLPPGLFYGQRLSQLENFLRTHLPDVELIFFDTTEI